MDTTTVAFTGHGSGAGLRRVPPGRRREAFSSGVAQPWCRCRISRCGGDCSGRRERLQGQTRLEVPEKRSEGRGSRVEGRGSRVEGRGSRSSGRFLCFRHPWVRFAIRGISSLVAASPRWVHPCPESAESAQSVDTLREGRGARGEGRGAWKRGRVGSRHSAGEERLSVLGGRWSGKRGNGRQSALGRRQ